MNLVPESLKSSLELLLEVCRKWAFKGHIFGCFLTPNRAHIRSKVRFLSICQKFPLDSHETCLLSSLELLPEICRLWAHRAIILGPFWLPNRAKIGKDSGFCVFCGLVLQNFAPWGCFPYILLYCCIFSLLVLTSGWVVIIVCGSVSVQGTSSVLEEL